MSVNRYQPHVLVLPEDEANRELANGFRLHKSLSSWNRRIQVLREVGGWVQVLNRFKSVHAVEMERWPERFMVLLIDFDNDQGRLAAAKAEIPEQLTERVFVLGVLSRPEALKQGNLGSYEDVGLALANDCSEDTYTTWQHRLLRHNASELDRLRRSVRPFLFPST
jgi:hypothetical protein